VSTPQRILVLGATGYVGGRLVPRLVAAGHHVRCLVRDPGRLAGLAWAASTDVVEGDLDGADGLDRAFAGVDVVYHLVHSMGGGADFAARDRRIARNVARAAAAAGVRRIVYLGGLSADGGTRSSEHLRSRTEVAQVLVSGPVPVTVLRAAVIVGSGSTSFEMLRYLVDVLPVMVTPRWVRSQVQPIAIRDVLRYLVGILDLDHGDDHTFDIAGPDVLTYQDMMRIYARVRRLPPRLIINVPLLTPWLSSHWVGLVTPVPAAVARPLVEGLVSDAVAGSGEDISRWVPGPCVPYRQALELALRRVRGQDIATAWGAAELAAREPAGPYPGDPHWSGGTLYTDVRTVTSSATASDLFRVVCGIGGDRGWPTHRWAWRARGALDRVAGGSGLRRGRRDPDTLRVGDALDFWRVAQVSAPSAGSDGILRLVAEMRLPGRAWLEFSVRSRGAGGSVLRQRASYAPRGLVGRLYWWVLAPMHQMIFPAMAATLARTAERAATSSGAPTTPRAVPGAAAAAADADPPPARRAE
jgi:uncharacterized protein YbjT (DUF2867 family)